MDEGTTLAELLALNLHECEDDVKTIVDKAVKEMSMEKMLRELQTTWAAMEFYQETHSRTGCSLLRASEKLIETLEENQVGCDFIPTTDRHVWFCECLTLIFFTLVNNARCHLLKRKCEFNT